MDRTKLGRTFFGSDKIGSGIFWIGQNWVGHSIDRTKLGRTFFGSDNFRSDIFSVKKYPTGSDILLCDRTFYSAPGYSFKNIFKYIFKIFKTIGSILEVNNQNHGLPIGGQHSKRSAPHWRSTPKKSFKYTRGSTLKVNIHIIT